MRFRIDGLNRKLFGVAETVSRGAVTAMCALLACVVIAASYALMSTSSVHTQAAAGQASVPLYSNFGAPRYAPVATGYIPLGRTEITVPILMYHYVQDLPKTVDRLTYNLTVTPANFSMQMDYLRAHDYHPVTMADLRAYFTGKHTLPSRPVVITFDDGYLDLYTTAFPILRAHDFRAVAYIVTSFVGEPRYVTAAMIVEMDRDGIEIASHTVDHANIAGKPAGDVTYEVLTSKQWLEKLVGHSVVDFAYPSGRFDYNSERILAATGYSTAVTELESTYHTWATRYAWSRTRVWGSWKLADFIKGLGPIEPFVTVTTQPMSDS